MVMDDSDDDLPNLPRLTPPRTRAKTPAKEPIDPDENDDLPDITWFPEARAGVDQTNPEGNSLPASGHQSRTRTRLSEEESREKEKGKC